MAFPLAIAIIGVIVVMLFVGIRKANHGTFLYDLDDPYIHLALSDQIRHGNYGLQAGTHAAPSSSIIFPFLLALGSGTALHPYLPLLLNLGALFLTAFLLHKLFTHLGLVRNNVTALLESAAIVLIALCSNTIGVVFTGLEHSLHIACVAAIVYGVALFLDRDEMPSWLPVAIVLGPLVRYEGMALSVGALFVLALRGRIRTVIPTFAVMVALVGGFSLFLIKLGLSPLPSSVLTKLTTTPGKGVDPKQGILAGVGHNIGIMLKEPPGMVFALVGIAAIYLCLREIKSKQRAWTGWTATGLMALLLTSLVAGQTVAGKWGWLVRYEDYALFGAMMMGIYLLRTNIQTALSPARRDRLIPLASCVAAGLMIVSIHYVVTTKALPSAANIIYAQQFQMHRFISGFWRGPVAVNDLGLVSYHNTEEVLDLGGLGSEKARMLIANHADADTYRDFVAANGIHLVMIYPEWFPGEVPSTWQEVGVLSLVNPRFFVEDKDVSFYATDDITAAKVRSELLEFQKTLPPETKLVIN